MVPIGVLTALLFVAVAVEVVTALFLPQLLPTGTPFWVEAAIDTVALAVLVGVTAIPLAVRPAMLARRRIAGHIGLLERVAAGAHLPECLDLITRFIESECPGTKASILLLKDGRHLVLGSAPSLSGEYNAAVDGIEIGPSVGSCGTAAWSGRRVIVSDISADSRWAGWRDLALRYGLRSCWSQPIRSSKGEILGTFAMYRPVVHRPNAAEARTVEEACHIASIAIERHLAWQAERRSEARLRAVVASAPDAILTADGSAVITWTNAQAERLLGYGPGELQGVPLGRLIPDRFRAAHQAAFRRVVQSGGERTLGGPREVRILGRDGEEIPAELCLGFGSAGDEAVVTAVIRDVRERLARESKLRRLARVVDAADDGILLTDASGAVLDVNTAFTRITGYSADDVRGQTPRFLKSGRHADDFYREMWETIRAGRAWSGRVIDRRKDGSLYHASLSISPVTGEDGRIEGYVGIQRDVTADVERERVLLLATRQAEAASRAKTRFLANMSHELRTPLTAILGYAELLEIETDDRMLTPEARREYVSTIKRQGTHLLSIINDVLDLAKIEADKLTVERESVSPAGIVDEVLALMRVRAAERGVELHAEYLSSLPRYVSTDPVRVRQVLLNLVGNAIKFTMRGEVVIRASFDAAGAKNPVLRIAVHDTGIGMDRAQVERLFTPFEQGDSSTTRRFGGTGLGLVISRGLAHMLGGGISVESEPGRGSVFTLSIPAGPLDGVELVEPAELARLTSDTASRNLAAMPQGAAPTLAGARILLAEDGPDNQRLISAFLRLAGAEVEIASNGRDAVDLATSGPSRDGKPFDLVLMDLQMPELDGYAATRLLRQRGYRGPIVALTAHAMEGDRQRCLDAGFDDYVPKPIDREHLINECVRRTRSARPETERKTAA